MRCKDGTADGQSHTGSVNLRGKKRIEDLVRLLRGQPYAGIADGDHKLLVFRSPRLDGKLARPLHILHRINAVTDEVHHDCNCTRSPMTWGRSAASSVRTDMEYRATSLRRRTIIS